MVHIKKKKNPTHLKTKTVHSLLLASMWERQVFM